MVATLVYYGLTLSTAQIGGNRFWNAFFNGFVEGPAYISSYFCLMRSEISIIIAMQILNYMTFSHKDLEGRSP